MWGHCGYTEPVILPAFELPTVGEPNEHTIGGGREGSGGGGGGGECDGGSDVVAVLVISFSTRLYLSADIGVSTFNTLFTLSQH